MKTNEKRSEKQALYLKKIKKNKIFVNILRVLIAVIFFGLWELATDLEIIDGFLMSSPSRIIKTIGELLADGSLYVHVFTTLYETLAGFILATVVGTTVALAMWWSENFRKIIEPYIIVLNGLPKIALGPIIIVWFGNGINSIVFMAFLTAVIVTTITMINGFLACENSKIMLLKSMGANKLQILTKLVLPSSLPTFISCLKINVGMAWIGSIIGEYLTSRQGIGYLIVYGGQVFKLDLVMASTLILCLLAGVMYALVSLAEKLFLKKY
ncbi:MAG: ABC transporter permease [Clostridia bacterium]|nr:ABC transporter permease [Clostridia bacterium]